MGSNRRRVRISLIAGMVTAAAVIVAGLTPPAQGQGMVRSAAPMAVPAISWHP
jgi:hypothetical protein